MKPTGNKKYKKIRMPGVNPNIKTKYDVQQELKAREEVSKIEDHEDTKFKYE